jgi:predicted nucleotidyltransferase
MEKNMELIERVKSALTNTYRERLKGVVLYGSEARGDSAPDSDIDLLILLEGEIELLKDVQKIVRALYPLQLEVLRLIHALPINVKDYEAGEYSLYRNTKKEGVPA